MDKRIEVGSSGNPNFIEVRHGKMLINVPRSIFKGRTSVLKPKEAEDFKRILTARYPWLSANAIDVIMEEARETMESLLDMEKGAVERARKLSTEGKYSEALTALEQHIADHPKDPDAWYLKGEIYFKMGRRTEGFSAFARAKGHSTKVEEIRRREH